MGQSRPAEEQPVGVLLNRLISRMSSQQEASLASRWAAVVGEDIAAHVIPLEVKGDVLVVGVDHPAWMQRTQMQAARIVRLTQKAYPDLGVRRLRVLHGVDDNAPAATHGRGARSPSQGREKSTPSPRDDASSDSRPEGEKQSLFASIERMGKLLEERNQEANEIDTSK